MTRKSTPGWIFWAALAINLLFCLALLPLAAQAGGISCTKGFGSDTGANGDLNGWGWGLPPIFAGGALGSLSGMLGDLAGSMSSVASQGMWQASQAAGFGAPELGPLFPGYYSSLGSQAEFIGGLSEASGFLAAGAIGYGIGQSPIGTAIGNAVGLDQTAAQNSALGVAVNNVLDYLGFP
jgi:hypothetical protein